MESHFAFGEREQGVILAHADVGPGIDPGAALANDEVAADDVLASELLHAETATG